jgi:type I restriction enzyme S subunit
MDMLKQGYKQTEIGVIPEEWEVLNFKDICFVNQGLQIPIAERLKNYKIGSKIYITIQYLNNGKDVEYITEFNSSVVCTKNDLLMTRTGNTGYVVKGVEGVFHNNFFKINYYEKIVNKDFLYFFLVDTNTQKIIREKAGTSTIPDLNHNDFYSLQIPLPTLPEQEAIAEALSDADAWIESLEQLIAKKRLIKQGAMQELLTPKDNWEVKKLGEVIETTQLGGNYQNSEEQNEYPLMKMGNLQRGYISLKKIEYVKGQIPSEKDLLKNNDLLFNTRNTLDLVGKVSIWRNELSKAYFNSNIMRICFNKKFIASNVFVNAIFNTKEFLGKLKDIATGTTSVAAIYTRDLFELEISFPSLSEQERIATILSDMDAELEALEQQLDKARQIKQGMMQELLTGRVRLV